MTNMFTPTGGVIIAVSEESAMNRGESLTLPETWGEYMLIFLIPYFFFNQAILSATLLAA